MPFPLAHPAAVLPLRRFCPACLSFPALVIGSLTPDLGYLVRMEGLSHSLRGILFFCLPAGLLLMLGIHTLLHQIALPLPAGYRRAFAALSRQSIGAPLALVLSISIGACLHLAWDSFTHNDGWLVLRSPLLSEPVTRVMGRTLRVCHLLWYASTLAGVTALGVAYQDWLWRTGLSRSTAQQSLRLRTALVAAVVVLPIAAAHHLFEGALGELIVAVSSAALILLFTLWAGRP